MTVYVLISWDFKTVVYTFYNKIDAESTMEYYQEKGEYGEMDILEIFVDTEKELY